MKHYYCFYLTLLISHISLAQNNYIQRAANAPTPGQLNTMVGPSAGNQTMTGSFNTYLGSYAGTANSTGYTNVFVGYTSGFLNKTGNDNAFLGASSGANNTSGVSNTFLGSFAGYANTVGGSNVYVGYRAGFSSTNATSNVFIGNQAGYRNTTASANVFLGNQAGYSNTTGIGNLFLGNQAGGNSNGSYNLFMGNGAGGANRTGEGNTAIGDGALLNSLTGTENTAIGRYAGINNSTGSRNTFIGTAATNPTGSGNLTNATAIGYNASVTASNALVLGNNQVNVGIGNSAPNNKLEITKGVANQSGLRFTNLTSGSPSSVLNYYKFLTVNANGDVILASISGAAREGETELLWERKGSFLKSSQNDAVIIGDGVSKTPSDYNLFVSKGILTERVKVAVKNTAEWSDYVFADTYQLRSLQEVERYVGKHGHLPGIPSAKEMVESGNDLHQTDAKLLAKIEELTLYSIQQQKEIDQLKQLVKQLLEKK
ncbi:hypothetical protein GCM10028807_44110 [Spirosoma daeguense]